MKKLLIIIGFFSAAQALDNAHFYRGNFFWGEPRFEREWLSTLDVFVGHGSESVGRDCHGKKTCLLNIYGPQNVAQLGAGLALDSSPEDTKLRNVLAIPGRGPFGLVQFGGKFKITEGVIDIKQNFTHGIFTQLNLPIRSLKITNIGIEDLSPTDNAFPDSTTPAWTQLILSLNDVLEHHGLSAGPVRTTGVGDFSWLVGWTHNHQNTELLDYVDVTVKTGVLFPTGKARNENAVFSLPTGYNKHWGIPFIFDASVGMWEWFTFGLNSGVLAFFPNTKNIRMKTSFEQNGFIKLGQGCARVYPGNIWHFGMYVKGDHFNERVSFLLGYSYNKKSQDHIYALDEQLFSNAIINTDSMLFDWIMYTIHALLELDFADEKRTWHPRISFYINAPVAGVRIFNTLEGGADFGLDVSWNF
jgi:hypothetical protein